MDLENFKEELKTTFSHQCTVGLIFTIFIVIFSGIIAGIAKIILNLI